MSGLLLGMVFSDCTCRVHNMATLPFDLFVLILVHSHISVKVKLSLYRPDGLRGLLNVEAPRIFRKLSHEADKFLSLTHRPPLPPGNIPGTYFCYNLNQLQGHGAAGRVKSMINLKDPIGNRTRNLPACSLMPQETALPRSVIPVVTV